MPIPFIFLFSAVVLGLFLGIILLRRQLRTSQDRLKVTNEKIHDIISKFASFRVRHGMVFETFLPQMKQFEKEAGPCENAFHMGQPIDFIYFNNDEIVFVEVKTGNSKLSNKQRQIRKLVKEGKVRWVELNDHFESALQDTAQTSSEDTTTTTSPVLLEPFSNEQSTD